MYKSLKEEVLEANLLFQNTAWLPSHGEMSVPLIVNVASSQLSLPGSNMMS